MITVIGGGGCGISSGSGLGGSSASGSIINNVFPLAMMVMVMVILLLLSWSVVDECRIRDGQQHNVR